MRRTRATQRYIRAAYARRYGPSPSRLIFAIIAAQQAADVLTTKYALGHGNREANPTAAPYVHLPISVLLALKVGLAGAAYLAWRWAEERHVRRNGERPSVAIYLPLLCTVGLYSYILTSNLAIDFATRT